MQISRLLISRKGKTRQIIYKAESTELCGHEITKNKKSKQKNQNKKVNEKIKIQRKIC